MELGMSFMCLHVKYKSVIFIILQFEFRIAKWNRYFDEIEIYFWNENYTFVCFLFYFAIFLFFRFRFVLASSEVGELNVVSTEYVETAELSKSLIVIISVIIVSLVLGNAAFVACFIFKRRSRRLKGNFVFSLLYIVACLLFLFILILYIVVC